MMAKPTPPVSRPWASTLPKMASPSKCRPMALTSALSTFFSTEVTMRFEISGLDSAKMAA
ncbi:hypothetical protein D3C87_1666930 [compost metagenome]